MGREKKHLFKSALKVSNVFKCELKTQKCKREKGNELYLYLGMATLVMSIGRGFFFSCLFSEASAHIGKPEFPILCAEKHCIQESEKSRVPQILWFFSPAFPGEQKVEGGDRASD